MNRIPFVSILLFAVERALGANSRPRPHPLLQGVSARYCRVPIFGWGVKIPMRDKIKLIRHSTCRKRQADNLKDASHCYSDAC